MTDKTVIKELRALEQQHGLLKAEDVVEAARATDSPLHDCFTWDDTEAARRWRLWQARYLIRSVVEYVPAGDRMVSVPVFCSLTPDREEEGGGYRSLVTVLSHPDQREQLLADALAELEHFQRKYAQYKELMQFKPLQKIFKEMEKLTVKKTPMRVPQKAVVAQA